MAEVYAGFLAHADHQIGRLLDYLEESGELDNTIIVLVSDNGASGEGGPNGSVNENKFFNAIPDTIEDNLPYLEELGSPAAYNHYPTGWACAFNTPFKLWKRYSNWEGGTADGAIEILTTERPQLTKPRNRYVYYPGHRRGPGVGRAEHQEPLVHDRGRGHDRQPGCRRGAVRPRGPVRRACAVCQGRQAQVLL